MNELEALEQWLKTYPGMPDNFYVDYNSELPDNAGIHPQGLMELPLGRGEGNADIAGNKKQPFQQGFSLEFVFPKIPDENTIATQNAAWLISFQNWVYEENKNQTAPKFGDVDLDLEKISATNGFLYAIPDDGSARYRVNLTARYKINQPAGGN